MVCGSCLSPQGQRSANGGRGQSAQRLAAGTHLVHLLGLELELEVAAVQLVDGEDRLDALGQRLAEHGLGLHADTLDAVDNYQGTVGDPESGGDLGREVDVARRVNQVDEELSAVSVNRKDATVVDSGLHVVDKIKRQSLAMPW